jgi:hypothetical protein
MAHRPTFNPAVGQAHGGGFRYHAPRQQFSERMQTAHTKIKYRHDIQTDPVASSLEQSKNIADREKLRQKQIEERRKMAKRLEREVEAEFKQSTTKAAKSSSIDQSPSHSHSPNNQQSNKRRRTSTSPSKDQNQTSSNASANSHDLDKHRSLQSSNDAVSSSILDSDDEKQEFITDNATSATITDSIHKQSNDDSASDSSEDEEDDEESLLQELAKIRAEREQQRIAEQKAAQEQAAAKAEEEARLAQANPLLRDKFASNKNSSNSNSSTNDHSNNLTSSFGVKRRWDSDLIFSGQQSGDVRGLNRKDRFINDTIRSDHHKQFMKRIIH